MIKILQKKCTFFAFIGSQLPSAGARGDIELRDVSFSYPSRPDIEILSQFNLSIKAGKSMALVGQSGSGKSTIIGLILRFYDPLIGQVRLSTNYTSAYCLYLTIFSSSTRSI